MSAEENKPKTKAGKAIAKVVNAVKSKKSEVVTTDDPNGVQDEVVITVVINQGGKIHTVVFRGPNEAEVLKKIEKVKRTARFVGSTMVRILVGKGKADSVLVKRIEKILSKI